MSIGFIETSFKGPLITKGMNHIFLCMKNIKEAFLYNKSALNAKTNKQPWSLFNTQHVKAERVQALEPDTIGCKSWLCR